MLFITEKRKDLPIYVSRLRRTIRFENGRYETFDLDEIAALERNPYVVAADTTPQRWATGVEFDSVTVQYQDVEGATRTVGPIDNPLDVYHDLRDLDALRRVDADGETVHEGRLTSEGEGDAGSPAAD